MITAAISVAVTTPKPKPLYRPQRRYEACRFVDAYWQSQLDFAGSNH